MGGQLRWYIVQPIHRSLTTMRGKKEIRGKWVVVAAVAEQKDVARRIGQDEGWF